MEDDAKQRLDEYRDLLISLEQKSQESYDKTILTLSSGALGISFAFVKDIIGDNPIIMKELLLYAWVSWGVSITSVLSSFFCSRMALRYAIKQFDADKIHKEKPGGWLNCLTATLNILGGGLFITGIILIISFISHNLR